MVSLEVGEPTGYNRCMDLEASMHRVADLVPGPALAIDRLELSGASTFPSAFDVDLAARTCAGLAVLADGGTTLDLDRLMALLVTHVEVDGGAVPAWADLSGYYDTADGGHIQLHCNFPHHAAGVVHRLGCDANRPAVQHAILDWNADELEAQLIDDGMIAARLRTMNEWTRHPHARATGGLPLIDIEQLGDAPPRPTGRRDRVLDCSRVLAGPIAGMTLAAQGCDVLRVGAAHLPSVDVGVLATGFGKRNAFADVTTDDGSQRFGALLDDADVWIDAYRPGAFERAGFGLDRVPPGAVVVQISAFDWVGPWAGRRGFDSIVQSTTGIVDAGRVASGRDGPTPLPVQALDYCTGLLAAFTAMRLRRHQAAHGGTWLARLSLLRARNWLVSLGGPEPFQPEVARALPSALHTVDTPFGRVTAARPILGAWSSGPQPLGSAEPAWLD